MDQKLEQPQRRFGKTVHLTIGVVRTNGKVSHTGKNDKVFGESRKDGPNQAVVASGETNSVTKMRQRNYTTNHIGAKVTAQMHWAPVVGTTNYRSSTVSVQRHGARVEGVADHNSTTNIAERQWVLVIMNR